MSEEHICQVVEHFFTQAIDYQELTLENLAAFVGMDLRSLLAVFSRQQWKVQRDAWVLQRLRQAMDEIYQAAKTQDDFSMKRIVERAGVDKSRLQQLAKDDFLQRKATLPIERASAESIHQHAEQFFAKAETYQELSLEHFTRLVGLDQRNRSRILSHKQWNAMKEAWLARHLQQAMDEIYQSAKIQTDFSARRIAQRVGVSQKLVSRSEEFQRLRATLPTAQESVLAVIKAMVDANIPLADFTTEKILKTAGTAGIYFTDYKWFIKARHAAHLELVRRQGQSVTASALPPGGEYKLIAGTWVDLNSDCWILPREKGSLAQLRRDRLREDFAEIAWSVLREELRRSGEIEVSTVVSHYNGFLNAGKLLVTEIPDLQLASLEALQRAWVQYDGTPPMRRMARIALLQLIETLINGPESNRDVNKVELLRMATWLGMVVAIPAQKPGEIFLSESELTKLLQGCLADIENGIVFTEDNPDLLWMSTGPKAKVNAASVVQWGTALMVLVMAFTGLRRQSVLQLQIHDWIQIRTGLFALVWRHGKKHEENLAVLPAEVAFHLDLYVRRTASVRAALGTELVFLNGSSRNWCEMLDRAFTYRLNEIAARYHLKRNGTPIQLGSTIFRRTFTTHALAEGRSLWALRAQLGHAGIRTTYKYAKIDRYEQPDQLRGPLDIYARQSLTLWHTPHLLDNLAPAERSRLLGTKIFRQQNVGLCRFDSCMKAERGSPPPCSLCEHLVTSFEFLPAWEAEQAQWEQELELLAATPQSEMIFAQKRCQFEQFQTNLMFVRENCGL